jgi:hypothetical protein
LSAERGGGERGSLGVVVGVEVEEPEIRVPRRGAALGFLVAALLMLVVSVLKGPLPDPRERIARELCEQEVGPTEGAEVRHQGNHWQVGDCELTRTGFSFQVAGFRE